MKALLRFGMPLLLTLVGAVIVGILGMHTLALSPSSAADGHSHPHAVTAAAPVVDTTPAPAHDPAHADGPAHLADPAHSAALPSPHGHEGASPCQADAAHCCSLVSPASLTTPFLLHAIPCPTVSMVAVPASPDLLLATVAVESPPSRELLSVIRV